MAKLIVRELSYRHRNGVGVTGINISIEQGEVFGLVGPNGAGKSTILRTCLGLHRPDSGEVLVETSSGPLEATAMSARLAMGYIPELPVLIDDLTGWDHLRYLAMAYGLPEPLFRQRAEQLLRRFGLWEHRHGDPFAFSKGMLQKLSVACALLHDPAVIFADEPFSGLDVVAQAELFGIFAEMKRDGKAIVLCTHNLAAAEQLCDHFLLLYQGQPLVQGDLEAVRQSAQLPGASLDRCFLKLAGGAS